MKMSSAFPSKYVRAADLNDREVTVVMDRIELEDVGDGHKPVLYFRKSTKGLVLNKTNAKVIAGTYGDDTDDWIDKTIILYPAMVDFRGDMVEAIRVRIPKKPLAKQEPAPASVQHTEANPPMAESIGGAIDDEIPF